MTQRSPQGSGPAPGDRRVGRVLPDVLAKPWFPASPPAYPQQTHFCLGQLGHR